MNEQDRGTRGLAAVKGSEPSLFKERYLLRMIYWKSDEDKFLDGELLFVPNALKEKIENENFRVEKRELIYLIWAALKSTPVELRSDWRRVHHGRFDYESSNTTNRTALLWLAENGFVELDKENSYWANPERGFPKKYRVIQKKQPVLVELENKSLVRGPKPYTQNEICCLYTREILDQLTVDRDAVKEELRKTIFEYHQLGDLTRNRPFTGEKNRIKQERFINTEFVEGLYTFGLPLLHLVNRTGSIKRGKKGNRLFSPMTNVKKTFRQYFSLEGEPLVWLDMQAAHPTLLGNLSNDQYLINDCLSDEFYGRIMDELEVDRDTAKRRYMAWAYDQHRPESKMTFLMARQYQTAANYVIKNKAGNYRRFSWNMQRMEADIFVDSVYVNLASLKFPALTVHDSIGIPISHAKRIKKLLLEELSKKGYRVKIKEETTAHTI
ncbi:MAG: hypothetical protein ACR2N1_09550 [Rubripirellula sp.]